MKTWRVLLLAGGPSLEREVSLRSGAAVAKALRKIGHEVTELDPLTDDWLPPRGTEVVFLALHGSYGEDGTVQAKLDTLGIPYTGCGAAASRVAFDKALTKQACRVSGLPVARDAVIASPDDPFPQWLSFPVVIKPVRQGSSVGLQFVDVPEAFPASLRECLKHDTEALVEERVMGRETTVGILDGVVLPVVEVRPKAGAYDYQNKYTKGATDYFCPAPFPPDVTLAIQTAALGAFHAVGGRDYGRVDVMVTQGGEPVLLEVNTLPGMTETSLLPKAAAAAGIDYESLCQRMLEMAVTGKGRDLK